MTNSRLPVHRLDLRVRELGQLFNSLDPTPFLNKDLDRAAEAYIESWAMGVAPNSRLHLTIHVEQIPREDDAQALLEGALHNYFSYKAGLVRNELAQLLRQGRISLLIGVCFVAACLAAADALRQIGTGPAYTVAREGLTIVGWVALWRPVQIFLYDWWPLRRRIHVYTNLLFARIEVVAAPRPTAE